MKTTDEIRDHLLCQVCEERFNKNGEDWVLEHCNRLDGQFKLNSLLDLAQPLGPSCSAYDASVISEIDIEKLAYFAASFLWRGAAHQWRFRQQKLRRVSLGTYEEDLRKYLLGQVSFPRNAVLVVDVIADEQMQRSVFPPFGEKREGGIWSYSFPFFGIAFMIVLGNTIDRRWRELCTYRSPQHFITRGMTSSDTILQWALPLKSKSRTVGKLAKRG